MGLPIVFTKVLAAADDDGVAASQAVVGAADLTLNGALVASGVAVLDTQRRVIVTSAGNDTGITFTVTGTNQGGSIISETITGASGAAATTTLDFKTVTAVSTSGAAAGNVKVGTNGIGASQWLMPNYHISPFNLSIACIATGTVNYTVQYTYDRDVMGFDGVADTPLNIFSHATLAAKTSSDDGSLDLPVTAYRLLINSGTGSVKFYALEAGIAGN